MASIKNEPLRAESPEGLKIKVVKFFHSPSAFGIG
jgi:hypothetical protein